MTQHSKPHGAMSPLQLIALFKDESRHANALSYELMRCPADSLLALAYQEHAETPFLETVPDALASAAYDEIERRQGAMFRLLADNPLLRERLGV